MPGALKPFWIYWGALVSVGIVILICPLLLLVILSLLLLIVPLWLITAYLIGDAVQRRSRIKKVGGRMALSLLCSLFTVAIYPVGLWLYDAVAWNTFRISSLVECFNDRSLWVMLALHFLAFWAGEEMGRLAQKV